MEDGRWKEQARFASSAILHPPSSILHPLLRSPVDRRTSLRVARQALQMLAAGHVQHLAGYEIGAQQKQSGGRDFVGRTGSPQRNSLRQPLDVSIVLPGR